MRAPAHRRLLAGVLLVASACGDADTGAVSTQVEDDIREVVETLVADCDQATGDRLSDRLPDGHRQPDDEPAPSSSTGSVTLADLEVVGLEDGIATARVTLDRETGAETLTTEQVVLLEARDGAWRATAPLDCS